ncbi:hypothetical protein M569_12395 [Genlisea aurea]|uniref:Pectinesterase inhibitor domain-containing protein n=1 Tax=Genlisea aurea TaxID=192259 RepID=S8DI41_9LAMI|nr:hypothetical protein M569_12395 [Genlisea aurea]
MPYRLFLVLIGVCAAAVAVAADEQHLLRLSFRPASSNQASKSAEPLVLSACRGVGKFESECISTLQSASKSQKTDANGLAFFALKYVEDHAANLTMDIAKAGTIPNLDPMFQAALSECMDQYTPLGDLIEDAINAVLANAYGDAKTFIDATISNIDVCDTKLRSSSNSHGKTAPDVQLAANMNGYNCFLKSLLSAANNVINSPSKSH